MNVLAIGAHYDDVEIGCGGSLLRMKDAGYKIHMIVITDSEYYNFDGGLLRSKEQARQEGTSAACTMGVSSIINLGYKAKEVECSFSLIESLNCFIDRIKPNLIFSHWYGDLHKDHYEVARATTIASRHQTNVLLYRSNWYHSNKVFDGRFYVDITDVIERKKDLLRVHKVEYERRGEGWIDFMTSRAMEAGLRIGVEYAEEFEIFKYRMDI